LLHPVSVTYSSPQEIAIKTSIDNETEADQQKVSTSQPRRPRQAPYPPRPMLRPTGTPAPTTPRKQGKQPSA
jgi:hypothetical protein